MEPPFEPPAPDPDLSEPRLTEPGFPLNRDDFTLGDLLSRASETWSRDLGVWVLAMLLYWLIGLGIPTVLGFVWGIFAALQEGNAEPSAVLTAVNVLVQVALQLVQLVLTAVFTLGFWAMAIRGLHQERATVGMLFSQLSKVWKFIAQSLLVGLGAVLIILPILVVVFLAFIGPIGLDTPMPEILENAGPPFGVASLVLLPLYIYIVAGIAFMQGELAFDDDAGPVEAVLRSWRLAHGKRWKIIGVGLVAGLIWVGSAMLCGVGLLFGGPFAMLLLGALYLSLRNGADVPRANTASTLGRGF